MRLGIRDAFATLFVDIGVAAALSVSQGWNWPLMNGVRMGIIALGLAGMVACSVSGWGTEVSAGKLSWTNPFVLQAILLGVGVTIAAVIGLFTNGSIYLTAMVVGVIGLWLVTVLHRFLAGAAGRPVTTA